MSVRPGDGLDPPLREYERQQGGYWLYGTDPYGSDKKWVPLMAEMTGPQTAEQAACYRPDAPTGYLAWWEWAERMGKTHTQRRCAAHGIWHEWVPREPADATPDHRQDQTDVSG
jgi:hypothetical protein